MNPEPGDLPYAGTGGKPQDHEQLIVPMASLWTRLVSLAREAGVFSFPVRCGKNEEDAP